MSMALKNFNGLVELLQFFVNNPYIVVNIEVIGIELCRLQFIKALGLILAIYNTFYANGSTSDHISATFSLHQHESSF
jgi:hypothetical protein